MTKRSLSLRFFNCGIKSSPTTSSIERLLLFESGDNDDDDDDDDVVVVLGLFGGSESTYIKLELIFHADGAIKQEPRESLTVDIFFRDHTFLLRQRRGEILISQYEHEERAR